MYSYTTFHPSQEGKHILQRAERCCLFLSPQKHQGPASFFCREAEVLFGALKRKSCLTIPLSKNQKRVSMSVANSSSEFFFFSGKKYWSRQKNADGEFSFCFVFLLFGQKKNEKAPLTRAQKEEKSPQKPLFSSFSKKNPENIWRFQKNHIPLHSLSERK